jgi:hypothetical protein
VNVETIGILTVVALVLATYRLTRLIVADKIFEGLRTRTVGSKLGYLVTCPFCLSIWFGFGLAIGQAVIGTTMVWQVFIGALALSAVVCILAALVPQLFD